VAAVRGAAGAARDGDGPIRSADPLEGKRSAQAGNAETGGISVENRLKLTQLQLFGLYPCWVVCLLGRLQGIRKLKELLLIYEIVAATMMGILGSITIRQIMERGMLPAMIKRIPLNSSLDSVTQACRSAWR
jgi:hypothetical protein